MFNNIILHYKTPPFAENLLYLLELLHYLIAASVSYFSLLHHDTLGTSKDHFSCLRFTIKRVLSISLYIYTHTYIASKHKAASPQSTVSTF